MRCSGTPACIKEKVMKKYKNMASTIICFVTITIGCLALVSCGGDDDSGGSGGSGSGSSVVIADRSTAFPGAEGGASKITGGAGKPVVYVTSLEDSGNGTLRAALNFGSCTILFKVSGTIKLKSMLTISNNDITIAGQTAPGDGITIANCPVFITGSNIIIRFIRFRMGIDGANAGYFEPEDGDALGAKGASNILIDHCSMSWSIDECASFSRVKNFTMQYCIISEALNEGHPKGGHSYGGIWGGANATYHHNLLADHDSRNPRFDHQYVAKTSEYMGPIDYVNNVVYNWGGNSTYGGEGSTYSFKVNMQNNYYKPGPSSSHTGRLIEITTMCGNCVTSSPYQCTPAQLYINGNYVNGIANKDWDGVDFGKITKVNGTTYTDERSNETLLSMSKRNSRYTTNLTPLAYVETAEKAYTTVLDYAGASLVRDAVDNRIIDQVKSGTPALGTQGKIIKTPDDVGGYPDLKSETAPTDTDGDGMPDEWEDNNGLNKNNANDGRTYVLTAKYTNLEVYLNSLVKDTFPAGAGASEIK